MIESDVSREARVHVGGGEYMGPVDRGGFAGIQMSVAGQEAVDRAVKLLAGVEGGVQKAVRSAINKAAKRLQSSNVKAVRERYAISAANIRENENVQVTYSYDSGVQAFVRFNGARIPLFRFDGASPHQPTKDTSERAPVMKGDDRWRMMYPGVAAAGHVLKSTSPYTFERAFVARMGSTGHLGIFERTGGMTSNDKDEIEELFGPSVPQMLGHEDVEKKLADDAMKSFEKDLDHAVLAVLSGYMR